MKTLRFLLIFLCLLTSENIFAETIVTSHESKIISQQIQKQFDSTSYFSMSFLFSL